MKQPKKKEPKQKEVKKTADFAIGMQNYKLLIIGFVIIIAGFILMIGGAPENPEVFNEGVFHWRRITLAPIIVLFGFMFEIWAIMKKPKEEETAQ